MPALPARLERLEPRFLLAGPDLAGEQLLGPLPIVTGVILTFSGPLDAASAENKAAYLLYRNEFENGNGPVKAFGGTIVDDPVVRRIIPFSSAVYDDTAHTVTLTPRDNFK